MIMARSATASETAVAKGAMAEEGSARGISTIGEAVATDKATIRFRLAATYASRVRGLLGTKPTGGPSPEALLLVPCSSIHTFGMSYALDVAFIDSRGQVIKACEGVQPGNVVRCRGSVAVLERESCGAPWLVPGERLRLLSESK